jgi:release factor glutamine methyltransferase
MSAARPASVGDALYHAERLLARRQAAEPRWSAQLLLEAALGRDLAWLYAHPEERLPAAAMRRFTAWVRRRARHEPVWYILGLADFYGLEFAVNGSVLIPRHETELLVDCALELGPVESAADACTGCGCVAIALAIHLPQARIFATDSSSAALRLARRNARAHGVGERISFLKGQWLQPLREPVHLIVANPPYVSSEEMKRLSREVRCYEPAAALHGGPDGMAGIAALIEQAPSRLAEGGSLILEIAPGRARRALALARRAFPAASIELRKDYAGRSRLLLIRCPTSASSRG